MTIEPELTKEGLPNARVSTDGKSATLHSRMPEKEALRICSKLNPEMKTVVLGGFGMGYVAEYLIRNTAYEVLIFEHRAEIFNYAQENRGLKTLLQNERLKFFSVTSDLIAYLQKNQIRELNFLIHRPYLTLFEEIYRGLEGELVAYLSKSQMNKATLERFQKVWLRNLIKNSRYYFSTPGINALKHHFSGKPALVIGAGPSLGKSIDLIKAHQKKAVLIAVDTALPLLAGAGITPDFTVTVDPQNKNAQFLLYSGVKESTLVADASGSFLALSKFDAPKLIYDTVFPLYRELLPFWGEKGALKAGGSVSTSAFDFARFLKADPIVFVGQDLSYPEKAIHYGRNILEQFLYARINRLSTYDNYNARSLVLSDTVSAEGFSGNRVNTDRKFLSFRDWFAKEIAETEATVLNVSEGGIKIPGAKSVRLEEVIQTFFKDEMNKSFSIVRFEAQDECAFLAFLHELQKTADLLCKKAQKARRAAIQAGNLFQRKQNFQSELKKMNEFDSAVLSAAGKGQNIGRFLELTLHSELSEMIELSRESAISDKHFKAWANTYARAQEGLTYISRLISKRLQTTPSTGEKND